VDRLNRRLPRVAAILLVYLLDLERADRPRLAAHAWQTALIGSLASAAAFLIARLIS